MVVTAAVMACSASPQGAAPELTYTQAAPLNGDGSSTNGNQIASDGIANAQPFSSLALAPLTVEWGDAAMNTSNPTGAHLFTGLNADLCLDVPYGTPANGTDVHIYQCNLIPTAQSWGWSDGQLRINDANGNPYCLSLSGGSLNANMPITAACTPTGGSSDPTQQWRWDDGLLRLADSNQCLGLTANTPQYNLPMRTYLCDANNATQQWRIGNVGIGLGNAQITTGVRLSSQQDSNVCIDLVGGDTGAGAMRVWACNPYAAQKWIFERGTLSNKDNACIGVDGAATSGATVKLSTCQADAASQKWAWSGSSLMLANTNLCLCVPPGQATVPGQPLVLGACPSSLGSALNCQWQVGLP